MKLVKWVFTGLLAMPHVRDHICFSNSQIDQISKKVSSDNRIQYHATIKKTHKPVTAGKLHLAMH